MTSLIFGATYLVHQGVVKHRHDKQRLKNYERWEGLRDEYDAQRKISQESRRSLDAYGYDDRPVLTLRDQQEANDARTSWRPQESFDGDQGRRVSEQITGLGYGYQHGEFERQATLHAQATGQKPLLQHNQSMPTRPAMFPRRTSSLRDPRHDASVTPARLRSQKTGAVWDEGLPAPLQVTRRQYDQDSTTHSPPLPNYSPPPLETLPQTTRSGSITPSSLPEAERQRIIDRQAKALAAIQAEHHSRSNSRRASAVPSRTQSPAIQPASSTLSNNTYESVNTNNPFERDAQLNNAMASMSVSDNNMNMNNPFERSDVPAPPSSFAMQNTNNPFERSEIPLAVQNTNNPFERPEVPFVVQNTNNPFERETSMQNSNVYVAPGGRMAELIERGY